MTVNDITGAGISVVKNISDTATNIGALSLVNVSFTDFLVSIKPFAYYVIALALYAIFVFKFYRFLARRDIISFDTDEFLKKKIGLFGKSFRFIFYILKYVFITPILVFFWFAILSVFLLVLIKSQPAESILLTAAAIVAVVRITAYYSEMLSQDLAKMIPFTLLGILLIDLAFFSIGTSLENAYQLVTMGKQMAYYLAAVILLEIVLRLIATMIALITGRNSFETESKSK